LVLAQDVAELLHLLQELVSEPIAGQVRAGSEHDAKHQTRLNVGGADISQRIPHILGVYARAASQAKALAQPDDPEAVL